MKYTAASIIALASLVAAEVPQEHSHEKFLIAVDELLAIDNPLGIQAAVFGLLGNAAASEGAGQVTNFDCLHQITADTAFTNAKAAGDVTGMTNALLFRAIERNTGSVGLKSVICNETAVNPEIAAISQHQDPASDNAAAENKAIVLALAQQLSLIGADPLLALESGTFAPGEIGDETAAGNTCSDPDDTEGCIFSLGLLVEDATAEEIAAAVAEVAGEGNDNEAVVETPDECIVTPPPAAGNATQPSTEPAPTTDGANLQDFAGQLGGPAPPVVETVGAERPFSVNGATFNDVATAKVRSCDIQNNACFNAINGGELDAETSECGTQQAECIANARATASRRARLARRSTLKTMRAREAGARRY